MGMMKISKMIVESLFKKPATYMYPIIDRKYEPITRGHVQIDIDTCIFCGMCGRKCPADAIQVDRVNKTWTIERMKCVQCSCCVDACPKKCLTMSSMYTSPTTKKVKDSFHARIPDNTTDNKDSGEVCQG